MPTSILLGKIREMWWFSAGGKSQKEEYRRKKRLRGIINAARHPAGTSKLLTLRAHAAAT